MQDVHVTFRANDRLVAALHERARRAGCSVSEYALTGNGTCMEPLIPDGTLLVGDKREQPEPGDVVIIHFTREAARQRGVPGWVKRLVHIWPVLGNALVTVEQLNPPVRYTIQASDIAAMHKCIGTATTHSKGLALFSGPVKEA